MKIHFLSLFGAVLLIALLGAGLNAQPARAAAYKIRWLDLSSVGLNSSVPSGTTFTLPGYNGVVTVSYTSTSPEWTRDTYLPMQNGIVTSPAGVYGWTSVDYLAAVDVTGLIDYTLTFTFTGPGPLPPPEQLVLGSIGLGGHLADGPTIATVYQNGYFLGDWNLGAGFGPTICTPSVNMFTLTNFLVDPAPGYFNTDFGLTRIDDSIAGSLTISVHQVGGDGIGFTIGLPEPNPCATNCIAIYNPDDIVVSTCSNSLPVFYSVNVSDTCCSNCVTLVSDPPSGYNFPLGTTTVTSTATDTMGNSNTCTFTVTVIQNTNPPVISHCPSSIAICASNGCGSMPDVASQVQATSSAGGSVVVSQDISPGTTLCSDTNVTFTVSDACGNSTNCAVPVILVDCSSNCFQVQCPSNIVVVSCTNVPVLYQPTVTDCCSNWTVVCSPTNGSYFSPGTTNTVYCLATDPCGHSNSCEFTVTVLQPTAVFLCPSNIVVDCTNDSGRVVNFPTVIGAVGTPQFSPPSGSTFLIGTTPVSCTATDTCGNVSTCVFDVTVRGYGNAIGHWVRSNCGNGPLTQGNVIAVDQNGNTFVGGVFSGTTNFCGVILSFGGSDGFVAKYDTLGTLLWVRQITGPGNEVVNSVAVDSQGNCYVVGTFTGAYVGFPDPRFQFYLDNPGAGGSDIFLAKYDPNGGVIWYATAGGPSVDNGEGVAVDDADNCYITGVFSGTANFGTTSLTSSSYDCFLAKWNSAGVFQWATNSTGTSGHGVDARSVAIDNLHGKAFITGEFSSDAGFGSTTLGPSGRFGSAFVAQLNLSNNSPSWAWAKQVNCTTNCGSQDGRAIGVDNAGNCYFTAYFDGTATIGVPAPTVNNFYPYSLNDYLIGKFSGTGTPLGLIKGLIQGDGEPRGLAVDRNSGDVYVTGFRHGLDSNADGGQDAVLLKYDSNLNLNLKWTQSGSGTLPNQVNTGRGVALDSGGCVYVTGSYTDNSFVFYNFLDGVHKFSAPSGTTKLFVAKYCSSCSTNCVTATIIAPLQNAWVSAGPSLANPISFTVTANGSTPLFFWWYRNNVYLAAPGGTGYTITVSPDGLSCTLKLTGVPNVGTGSTYTVYVGNGCCDCTMASSHASIFYWIIGGGGTNPVSRYQLGIAAGSGVVYRVEYRDDLNPGTPWQLLTNMIGTGTNPVIFDPNPNPLMRFYQIPLEPDP